jgi:hypothetical protein
MDSEVELKFPQPLLSDIGLKQDIKIIAIAGIV